MHVAMVHRKYQVLKLLIVFKPYYVQSDIMTLLNLNMRVVCATLIVSKD